MHTWLGSTCCCQRPLVSMQHLGRCSNPVAAQHGRLLCCCSALLAGCCEASGVMPPQQHRPAALLRCCCRMHELPGSSYVKGQPACCCLTLLPGVCSSSDVAVLQCAVLPRMAIMQQGRTEQASASASACSRGAEQPSASACSRGAEQPRTSAPVPRAAHGGADLGAVHLGRGSRGRCGGGGSGGRCRGGSCGSTRSPGQHVWAAPRAAVAWCMLHAGGKPGPRELGEAGLELACAWLWHNLLLAGVSMAPRRSTCCCHLQAGQGAGSALAGHAVSWPGHLLLSHLGQVLGQRRGQRRGLLLLLAPGCTAAHGGEYGQL